MFKRVMAMLFSIAMFLSLMSAVHAEGGEPVSVAEAVSGNNESIRLLADAYSEGNGSFTLHTGSRFYLVSASEPSVETKELAQFISRQFALEALPSPQTLSIVYGEEKYAEAGDILLKLDFAAAGGVAESYKITVDANNICIVGADSRGLMYGAFMVIKYMRANGSATMAGCTIQDSPDTIERAAMLDCGRKYFTPEWIKNYIRQLAFMGYNTFEIHFAEDQGIRLDIWDEAYFTSANGNDFSPLVGGWAASWLVDKYETYADEDKYLTAAEMIEILEVAKQYQIDIIPSFDTPMHCQYLRYKWRAYVMGANEKGLYCPTVNKNFSFNFNGIKYSKNGKTNLSTGKTTSYSGYDCWEYIQSKDDSGNRGATKTIDVTNPVSRHLLEAILTDYADFFKQYGCTEFNICGDEVAFYTYDGWQGYARDVLATKYNSSTLASKGSKYDTFIDYINEITDLLQARGYTVRIYSDFVERNGTSYYTQNLSFDDDLEIMYWWLPGDNSAVQPVSTFVNKGYKIYNCVQNYTYYVLATNTAGADARDPETVSWTWQYASADRIYNYWNPTVFTHPTKDRSAVLVDADRISGGYFLIWCDYGAYNTETQMWVGIDSTGKYNMIERMWSNITKMWNHRINSTLSYESFAALADTMGYYPGYTDCTKTVVLPEAKSVKPAHTYVSEVTSAPSCTEAGVMTYTCSTCGESYTESIPATGHLHTELRNAVTASCTESGYTGDTYCTDCGTLLTSGEVIPSSHSYKEVSRTEPTCTAEGRVFYTCTLCGTATTQAIPATGHLHTELRYQVEATPGENGYTGDTVCTDCGAVVEVGTVLPALPVVDKISGIWMWASTLTSSSDPQKLIESYAKAGITDIYFLVKGTNGKLAWNSKVTNATMQTNTTGLDTCIQYAKPLGIRVHAWLTVNQDDAYVSKTGIADTGDMLFVFNDWYSETAINFGSQAYMDYMAALVDELITNYDIDGIHLDSTGYKLLYSDWGLYTRRALLNDYGLTLAQYNAVTAAMCKDQGFTYSTASGGHYQYSGKTTATPGYFADCLTGVQGSSNAQIGARAVYRYRTDKVTNFIKYLGETVADRVTFSCTLQPEIPGNKGLCCVYGQDPALIAPYVDYAVIMTYAPKYGEDASQRAICGRRLQCCRWYSGIRRTGCSRRQHYRCIRNQRRDQCSHGNGRKHRSQSLLWHQHPRSLLFPCSQFSLGKVHLSSG